MKKFVFGLFATLGLVGFVAAETFNADVTKVEGNTVTAKKVAGKGGAGAAGKKGAGGKKGAKADPQPPAEDVKYDLAPGVVVGKGVFDMDTKGLKLDGDAFKDGVKNEAFKDVSADKMLRVSITTADEDKGAVKKGQVTQILIGKAGGKGGFGTGKGAGKKGKGAGTEK